MVDYTLIQYFNKIRHNEISNDTIKYNTIQENTIQYSTIKYNTVHYNKIQYKTVTGINKIIHQVHLLIDVVEHYGKIA